MKRINTRAILIENNYIYLIFRRKNNKEYYVIPGGGLDVGETIEENVLREIKEELSVDIDILGYLGKVEEETSITYFYNAEIIKGIPKLGGEELEKHSRDNFYEIRKVSLNDIINIDVSYKDIINKAINKEYKDELINDRMKSI